MPEEEEFESCVAKQMEQGKTREEAEEACRPKPPATEASAAKSLEDKEIETLIGRAVNTNDLTAFSQLMKQIYEKKAQQLRKEIAEKSIDFMKSWKEQILRENVEAMKATLAPTKKTPLFKEDLAQAIREVQLELAEGGKKTAIGDIVKGGSGKNDYVQHPGTVGELTKRIEQDMEKSKKEAQGDMYVPPQGKGD